jgi:tetratricopeptide (TPR) repeat protein
MSSLAPAKRAMILSAVGVGVLLLPLVMHCSSRPAPEGTGRVASQISAADASTPSGAAETNQRHTVAHDVLALEEAHLPKSSAQHDFLNEVVGSAISAYNEASPQLTRLPERERAQKTFELIEAVLQRHHFVYPSVGYVAFFRDGLAPVNVNAEALARLAEEPENFERTDMIMHSPGAAFHIADCDVFSTLFMAIGEALALPIAMVDLPEPPGGVGHNYVTWTLHDGSHLNWEAMSGRERQPYRDNHFFEGAPRSLSDAVAARAFGVPLTRDETVAYWYLIAGSKWTYLGAYATALACYRSAINKNPKSPKGYNEAAWLLATCPDPTIREPREAVAFAEKLQQLWPSANYLDTAAAAYAASGRWEEAIETQQRAVKLAERYDPKASGFKRRLSLYENHVPYIAPRREEQEAENWREVLANSRWDVPPEPIFPLKVPELRQ